MTVIQVLPERSGQHFYLIREALQLRFSLTHILIGAIGGIVCGILGILLIKFLLKRRTLTYPLSAKTERLLAAAMLLPGAAVGAFTQGVVPMLVGLLLLILCFTVSVTDCAHRILPNEAALAVILLKLLFGIPTLCGASGFIPFDILQSVIGLVCCFAVFALPGLFGKKVGAGDIKLAAAMGFFLGINFALLAVVLMGLLVIVFTLVQRKAPFLVFLKTYVPMGPFIASGMFISYLVSQNISF